jgi:hypothetical protein
VQRAVIIAALAACAAAQGTPPRASADGYPAHGAVGELRIGAEYLVHSMPAAEGLVYVPAYLVVEVAVFGPPGARANLAASYFSLRLNGSRQPILAQQPFLVANAMEGPRPGSSSPTGGVVIGIGGIGTTAGRPADRPTQPPPVPDPSGRTTRTPPPVETPNPYLTERAQPVSVREQVEHTALPSGDIPLPAAGALFFAYRGKTEQIKTIELLYEGPAGMLTLHLRP